MSWDILIFAAGSPMPVTADGKANPPDDWTPIPLGSLAEIHDTVCTALPQTDWSDERWGRMDSDTASLEFNLGTDDPVTSLMVHARGHATPVLVHLMSVTGWVMLDMTTGMWLNTSATPDAGREQHQATLTRIAAHLSRHRPRSLLDRLLRRNL